VFVSPRYGGRLHGRGELEFRGIEFADCELPVIAGVVEGHDDFVIIDKNGVHKSVYEFLAAFRIVDIQLAKFQEKIQNVISRDLQGVIRLGQLYFVLQLPLLLL
jgi:hypothetical protein